jgi:hypothetical protein
MISESRTYALSGLGDGELHMPLFFLTLTRGTDDLPNDHEGHEFPDVETARIEAVESLREIAANAILSGSVTDCDGIDIRDQDGKVALRVEAGDLKGRPE